MVALKLLVFAHTPPPHHGQSYMVKLMLDGLGGNEGGAVAQLREAPGSAVVCYHVDARLSADLEDVGQARLGKLLPLVRYCCRAWYYRFRHGVRHFYYIPAPSVRAPLYRDWIVMALCRPVFSRVIFHWHASGLGTWLDAQARPWERWLSRLLLGRADLSLVLGDHYRQDVQGLSPKKVALVPNGIPDPCPDFERAVWPRRLARSQIRAALLSDTQPDAGTMRRAGEAPQVFRVLFLSTCAREKGVFDAVEAAAGLNRQLAQERAPWRVRLTVAGKFGREEDRQALTRILDRELNTAFASQKLCDYVGFVNGAEKTRLYVESDCFCFPTFYPFEVQPVSLLEAMAFGLPVVTTRWRGLPEFLPPGYPGVVDVGAPDQIAQALRQAATAPPDHALRTHFQTHFTVERFMSRLVEALREVE